MAGLPFAMSHNPGWGSSDWSKTRKFPSMAVPIIGLLLTFTHLTISPPPHSHPCPPFRLPNQEGHPRWGIHCPNFSLCAQNMSKPTPNIISALHVNQNNDYHDENTGSFPFAQTSERFYKFLQGLSRFMFEDNFTKHTSPPSSLFSLFACLFVPHR